MPKMIDKASDEKLFLGLIITLGVSMLLPEFIAPLLVFGLYIHFLKQFRATNRKAKLGEIGKIFFTYTIFMVASAIWSSEHLMSFLVAMLWMGCMLSYILVANIITTEDKLKNAITALNISTGIIGAISILEFATYNLTKHISWFNFLFPNPFYWHLNKYIFEIIPIDIINYIFASRSSATFDNPLILSTYLVIAIPFCAFGSVYFKESKHRKISRLCLLFGIGGLVGTSSRAGFIALAVSIFVMLLSNKKILKKMWFILVAIAVALPVGLLTRYKNLSFSDFLNSDSQRIGIWKSCFDMWLHKPILGLGAGTEPIHQQLLNNYDIPRTHAHNLFLEMLVEGGIIGGAFVVAIIVLIVRIIIKTSKLKDGKYRSYGICYIASLIAFTIASLTEFTLQSAKELMIFFFLLGFIEATFRIANDNAQPIEIEQEIIIEKEEVEIK